MRQAVGLQVGAVNRWIVHHESTTPSRSAVCGMGDTGHQRRAALGQVKGEGSGLHPR